MYVMGRVTNKIKPNANVIAAVDIDSINPEIVEEAIENVNIVYDAMGGNDSVAKGKEFVSEVIEILSEKIN